jgi:phosphoserine phosphatase RsbU/P
MNILIADDALMSRTLLQAALKSWGYAVTAVGDGQAALAVLSGAGAPKLAILDWMMPGLSGVEVCRRLREGPGVDTPYVILLTARTDKADVVTGLEYGADDYITKPFDRAELKARLQVGERVVDLQRRLADQARALEEALTHVRQLQGLLPICTYCKKVRDDQNYWQQVESFVADRSAIHFSHCICPDCWNTEVVSQLQQMNTATGETAVPKPHRMTCSAAEKK